MLLLLFILETQSQPPLFLETGKCFYAFPFSIILLDFTVSTVSVNFSTSGYSFCYNHYFLCLHLCYSSEYLVSH